MADNTNILGGRLSIEDAFSSPLDKFASKVQAAENRYNTFVNNVINGNRKMENSMNQTFNNLEKIVNKFVANENKVANSINNANNKVKQNQEKTIDELILKYGKLGEAIKKAYANGENATPKIPRGQGSGGENDSLKDFAQSFLQSGFAGILGKLGLIGAGVTAGITVMKTLNNWMEQGFDVLNKVTDGLLSPEGIKDAVQESMGFETGRMKLDLFYGSEDKGLAAYQTATNEAGKTYANEKDTVDIMSKMGQLGVSLSGKQLEKFLDVAGTRSEVGTDHIGLAVKEAIEGRIGMLQMYGINNRNLKKYYDGLGKSDPKEHKALKGALNKKGTAGDPQKYVNLLTDYIEHSPMNNYAEKYATTLQGKLERMEGVWTKLKAEIMGIDTNTGIAKEGGVFSAIGKMVNQLGETLKNPETVKSLEKVGNAFGSAFTAIGNAFTKAVTPETIDKVASAIAKIGEALAKMIDKFVSSGQLDKLLAALPNLTEKFVSGEVVDKVGDVQSGVDASRGHLINAGADKLGSFILKSEIGLGLIKPEEALKIQTYSSQSDSNDRSLWENIKYNVGELGTQLYNAIGWLSPITNDKRLLTDANANTAIDKNKNLTDDQKQTLKDYIKTDSVSTYNNITIHQITANNFDEIMNSIEAAAGNRK